MAIVPTKREAERWEKAGSVVVTARNIDKVLTSLKGTKGSFLALVAKYDGVDLPDDDCRLLVLDSLPRAATLYDRYFQSMMQSTAITNAKIAQKIEQGLGRATRGKSDYCAILITGTDLVSFIRDNHNRRHLSPGTNVRLELGLVIASEIKKSVDSKGFSDAIVSEINRCLSRDEEWKSFYRDFLEHARERAAVRPVYEEGLEVAKTEHTAAAVFLKRDYQGAAQQIQTLVDRTTSTEREKGWFLQLSTSYLYLGDKSKALSMQKKAFELNGALFVPPDGTAYHRLADRGVSQAALSLRYRLSFENANAFVSEAHSSCDHLAFGIEAHSFESALNDVAKIIGISSNRPEATIGKGPDCLWMGDNGTYFIIEAKSEVELTRTEIHKSETEQLIHSCEWFEQEYVGKKGLPFSFHPATKLAHEAVFPVDGRVVTPDVLAAFVARVRSFVVAVSTIERGALTQKELEDQLQANNLMFDRCFSGAKRVSSSRG